MMREEIAASAPKNASEIVVYADAQHGFNADYRPSYNKADADDAWKKMLEWMKKNGVEAQASSAAVSFVSFFAVLVVTVFSTFTSLASSSSSVPASFKPCLKFLMP